MYCAAAGVRRVALATVGAPRMGRSMSETPGRSSPFTEAVGVEMEAMEAGRARATLVVSENHFNSGGIVHGGVLMTLADCVAGAAAHSLLDKGQRAVTTDAHLTCLRSVTRGELNAEAEVVHAGRRLLHARLSLSCNEQLIASGVYTFMRIEHKGA